MAETPGGLPPIDPELHARLWQLIADIRAGTAEDAPVDFLIVSWLFGAWENAMVTLRAAANGVSREQAERDLDEFIESQRVMTGSLAATPGEPV